MGKSQFRRINRILSTDNAMESLFFFLVFCYAPHFPKTISVQRNIMIDILHLNLPKNSSILMKLIGGNISVLI